MELLWGLGVCSVHRKKNGHWGLFKPPDVVPALASFPTEQKSSEGPFLCICQQLSFRCHLLLFRPPIL